MILAYCISETQKPKLNWKLEKEVETIETYFSKKGIVPERYGKSYVFKVYDTSQSMNYNEMEADFHDVLPAAAVADEPELPEDQQEVEEKGPRAQRQRAVETEHVVDAGNGSGPQGRAHDQHNAEGQEIQPEDKDRVSFQNRFKFHIACVKNGAKIVIFSFGCNVWPGKRHRYLLFAQNRCKGDCFVPKFPLVLKMRQRKRPFVRT